jgi:hypothetical protein
MSKGKNSSSISEKVLTGISYLFSFGILFLIFGGMAYAIIFSFWGKDIKAFFANSPKQKCEAYIEPNDKDAYCNDSGSKGSKIADKKSECEKKTPYFVWNSQNECEREKYESYKACVDDGRQGSFAIEGEPYHIRCLEDGTWESFDPDYEDWRAEQSKGYCTDVTSYDYNWDNDMLCTKPDGSKFYTSYEGARTFENY